MQKRVLLVEDDPIARAEIREQIEPLAQVDIACDGLEAIRKLHGTHYDCVVVDLTIPLISAYQIFRELGHDQPSVTRVALSTARDRDLRHFDRSLAHAVVHKTSELARLNALVA